MSGDTYWHTNARDFKAGDRVELHPAMDAWVSGDRYGVVAYDPPSEGSQVRVRMFRSGRLRLVNPQSLKLAE